MRSSEKGLFPALEAILKASKEPLDCQTLFEMAEVRKYAASVNRVSDYLGGLWRKGLVVRLPAPKSDGSRARWMYEWKGHRGPALYGEDYIPHILADRPTLLVTEEGNVLTLETPHLIISIRQKPAT